jgi:peptidoglycan/xylan/chitin deacetylase (PgdA/CDA1 family)
MSLLRQATKQMLAACVPSKWLLTRGPAHAANTRPRVALTFDDGPHPGHTARLLDLLSKAGLKATFFVVGSSAAGNTDLVRRMADEGHEVANHTWFHHEPLATSSRQFLDEVKQTDACLKSLTGVFPRSMRPPKGELNWSKLTGLWQQGKTVALWNVDPRDYRMSRPEEIRDWAADYKPQDGDVVLFHDNHPWAAIAVEVMLDRGVFDQFEAVTVLEMVGHDEFKAAGKASSSCKACGL